MSSTTNNQSWGAYVAMDVTNLQSLAKDTSDPYGAWQSVRVDNQTSVRALDYEIGIHLPTAASAPANDLAAYAYLIPWVFNGSTWLPRGNFGTIVLPTGVEGTASISDPNSMAGPIALPYKVISQILQKYFTISQFFGGWAPDGWSLAIRNNCGADFLTGCVVEYRPLTLVNS